MNLEELRSECLNCQKCKLCTTRTNVVFGVGSPNADVLFIGEGPGENEDLRGEPFVGRGGILLDTKRMNKIYEVNTEGMYIECGTGAIFILQIWSNAARRKTATPRKKRLPPAANGSAPRLSLSTRKSLSALAE